MKDKYKKMRNSQKIDNNWIFQYYLENGGKIKNKEEFLLHFYYEVTPMHVNGQLYGHQKINRDLSTFFEDMDKKMEITTLWDKDGSFIKVV